MIRIIKNVFSPSVMHSALEQFGSVSLKAFFLYAFMGMVIVILITTARMALGKKIIISDVLTGLVLAVYGSVMLQLTLICRESGSRIGIDLDLFHGLLGPENTVHWLMWAYIILNCLLFIPFGFTISLFSFVNEKKPVIQMLSVLLLSFIVSMIIECTQLITQRGYYEVQDLLVNTLGGVLGWVLFSIIYRLGALLLQKSDGRF